MSIRELSSRSMKSKREVVSADSALQIASSTDSPLQTASSASSTTAIKMRRWNTKEEEVLEKLFLDSVKMWGNVNFLEKSYWQRLCTEYNNSRPEGRSTVTCMDIIDKGKAMKKEYDSSITSQDKFSSLLVRRPALVELFRPCDNCCSRIPVFPYNTSENVSYSSDSCSDGGDSCDNKMMETLYQMRRDGKLSEKEYFGLMETLYQMRRDGKLSEKEWIGLMSMADTFSNSIVKWVSSKDTPPELVIEYLRSRLQN